MSTALQTPPAEAGATPAVPVTIGTFEAKGSEKFSEDQSYLSDPKKAEKAFDSISEQVAAWFTADTARSGATKVAAVAVLDLREYCVRGDNAAPDWSGQVTAAYRFAYSDRIKARYREVGMTDSQIRQFESAVRSMLSDSGMLDQRIADYIRRTDSGFSSVKAADIAPGKEIPKELRDAIVAEKAKQTNKSGTKVLRGFTPDTVPEMFGTKAQVAAAQEGGTGGAGNVGQATPAREWQKLRERIAIQEGTSEAAIAPLAVADEMFRLATVFSQRLVGKPGEKSPQGPREKAKVRDTLSEMITLLTLTRDVLAGETKAKEQLTEHYWQG